MGRYAQQRKRGGHLGDEPGLPAGPATELWGFVEIDGTVSAKWTDDGNQPFDFWRSRWRVPAVSMLWTFSADDAQPTQFGTEQASPFPAVPAQLQQCEVMFCDVAGNPQSQWSAFQEFTLET